MNRLSEVFSCSTDAVFGIDAAGRIRYVNPAFARLLGYPCRQLAGKRCAEVLCGTDMHGQPFCGSHCPVPRTAPEQPAISDFDLLVRRADGDQVLVNIGASYIPRRQWDESGQVCVFFSLREANPRRLLQRMALAPDGTHPHRANLRHARLTSREREVLGLAVTGLKTRQIACRLSVSEQTVRTHFKNIYPKLGVNSRTEAVIHALRHGLH